MTSKNTGNWNTGHRSGLLSSVKKIDEELYKLEVRLVAIQRHCKHKYATVTYNDDHDGWSRVEIKRWRSFYCPQCRKWWRKEGHE